MDIDLNKIKVTYQRISQLIHKTPVLTSETFNSLTGKALFFKCENLQKTGSFKVRGATNAVLAEKERDPKLKGVLTHSSGNHGQAVAWAAKNVGQICCTVVVPENTSQVKVDAIRGYGAEVVFCEASPTARKESCAKIAGESGYKIVHPYDNFDVITGQCTLGYEFHEQVSNLDAILVPISGGGLTSGIALSTKALNPNCKVIAVEPRGKELGPCLRAKARLWKNPPQFVDTIAEGIKTQQLGELTFPIVCENVEPEVITISDEEMAQAMKMMAERMKLVIEASAGASVAAAVISDQLDKKFPGLKRVGVILCGGNTDVDHLPWVEFSKK